MKLTIDYETRSRCNLKKAGTCKYAAHTTTEAMCMSVKVDDEPSRLYWPRHKFDFGLDEYFIPKDEISRLIDLADEVEAHNALFEIMITQHKTPFMVDDDKWRCSAARAAAMALPRSLKDLCKALGTPLEKDEEGRQVMLKLCKPDKKTGEFIEDPEMFHTLGLYCMRDTDAEYEAAKLLDPLSKKELAVWKLDRKINVRGIRCDVALVPEFQKVVDKEMASLRKEFRGIVKPYPKLTSPTQVAKTVQFLEDVYDFRLDDLKSGTLKRILKRSDLHPNVRRVLELRQMVSKSSTAKLTAMLDSAMDDHRMRDLVMYHGASTGRWTGKRVQPHNFPRGSIDDAEECIEMVASGDGDAIELFYSDVMSAMSSCLRGLLIAGFGKDLLCADYSAIEGRVLAWLAGEYKVLKAYAEGLDMYLVAAADTLGVPYESLNKDDNPTERGMGKVEELALGYQGGVGAMETFAVSYEVDFEEVYHILKPRATREQLEKASDSVDRYFEKKKKFGNRAEFNAMAAMGADLTKQFWRLNRPETVALWYRLEDAAVSAVENPGTPFKYRHVAFMVRNGYMLIKLPSGRYLHYKDPEIRNTKTPWGALKKQVTFMGVDGRMGSPTYRKWARLKLYGGLLAENITQAVARDIMAEGMLKCEAGGYPIILTVHDEILSEVPERQGDLDEFIELMTDLPDWAEGLPIAAAGWRGKRYKKD